jgi:hypothetical protein
LIGQYIKTERNGMVKDHYARLGFVRCRIDVDDGRWRLDIASYVPAPTAIDIVEAASTNAPEEKCISV